MPEFLPPNPAVPVDADTITAERQGRVDVLWQRTELARWGRSVVLAGDRLVIDPPFAFERHASWLILVLMREPEWRALLAHEPEATP